MRTDERAGQAAKHMLAELEARMRREDTMDPDGAYVFMTPDQRLDTRSKIDLLKKVCGCD